MLPFFEKLPPCLIGMEACATAHHWARQLIGLGHEVRLMPPHYMKPYVKRGKNDAADAAAIGEAVTRPTMRFVSVKGMEQQSVLMLHRTRELLVRQRTMVINAIRAHMAEFGIVAPVGVPQVKKLLGIIADTDDARLPSLARTCLESLARQFLSLHDEINRRRCRPCPTPRAGCSPQHRQLGLQIAVFAGRFRPRKRPLNAVLRILCAWQCRCDSMKRLRIRHRR